jgi:glycosyltransferase involved in cell wall biosynthesis
MGGAFVVGSHHLAKSMAVAGHHVCHVSPPLSLAHCGLVFTQHLTRSRFKRWLKGGELIGGVRELAPFTFLPWNICRSTKSLSYAYSRYMLAAPWRPLTGRDMATADCVLVDDPRFVGLARTVSGGKLIYRATDLYSQMRKDPSIDRAERIMCQIADVVVATSVPVAEHLRALSGEYVHIIHNGVDVDHFEPAASPESSTFARLPGQRHQRALYVGAFDERFGYDAVKFAAQQCVDKFFILAGPGSLEACQLLALQNVTGLGAVPYGQLPELMHACVVGLLPLSDAASNRGRSPMKLYEYAAAGMPVAASHTPELERRQLPTLFLGESSQAFAAAVSTAFSTVADKTKIRQGRDCARAEKWSLKAEALLALATKSQLRTRANDALGRSPAQ